MFNLHAGHHEVIPTSESCKAEASALGGFESVRVNGQTDARFERKTATNDRPFFDLKAANGEPLGRGEVYASAASMENGVRSVIHHAADATVKDHT